MIITKAIEILSDSRKVITLSATQDYWDAQNLGIEAMKREQLLRHELPYYRDGLLPGETEE